MHLMLQQEKPQDFVIASGEAHTVREFVEIAAKHFDFDIQWEGEGENEVGINKKDGKVLVSVSPEFYRPSEVNYLLGDPSKAKQVLGWTPRHSFEDLIKSMVESDNKLVMSESDS